MEAIRRIQPVDIRTAATQARVEETTAIRIVMRGVRLRTFKDRRDPEDARRSLLTLTEAGSLEFDRIAARLDEIQSTLCEGIPKRIFPEVHRLTRIVARLPE
jgi:DNA-binding MarR family transcriptional regulator